MKDKDKIIIKKIIVYIEDIKTYVGNMQAEEFFEDKKTITACAFSISQIGELAKEVSEDLRFKYNDIKWSAIRGMRNKIVHDYEGINLEVFWGTIKNSLPDLKLSLEKILIALTSP